MKSCDVGEVNYVMKKMSFSKVKTNFMFYYEYSTVYSNSYYIICYTSFLFIIIKKPRFGSQIQTKKSNQALK